LLLAVDGYILAEQKGSVLNKNDTWRGEMQTKKAEQARPLHPTIFAWAGQASPIQIKVT
jgi:hypothetical protein